MLPSIVLWVLALDFAEAQPAAAREPDHQAATARPRDGHAATRDRPSNARPASRPAPSTSRPAPKPQPAARPAPRPAPAPAPRPSATPTPRPTPAPKPSATPTPRPAPSSGPSSGPSSSGPSSASPGQRPSSSPDASPSGPPQGATAPPHRIDDHSGQPTAVPTGLGTHASNVPPHLRVVADHPAPNGALRPYDTAAASMAGDATVDRPDARPPHRSGDPRYSRPDPTHVRPAPYAHSRPPIVHTYSGWYTGWYCHPWYRYQYGTWAVVSFGFYVDPWAGWWIPPARWGWGWSPGYWSWGVWWPGYWAPMGPSPVGYVYVPGWWENTAYVEGYYRTDDRDGWEWVEGFYLEDGTYVRGHWRPTTDAPDGYTWEPGFWDGKDYVDGFWRPQFRKGFVWISSFYDEQGIFHSGYWAPTEEKPGHQWVPGWFDGNEWVPGYWVSDEDVKNEDVQGWKPPEGFDDGWKDEVDPREYPDQQPVGDDAPLAIPVPAPADAPEGAE